MRSLYLLLTVLISSVAYAQPQAFKYQSVVRDSNGDLLVNKNVAFQISIIEGDINSVAIYTEEHQAITSSYGSVTLEIGRGENPTTDFSAINWAVGSHFVQVAWDLTGGTNYELAGTSELLSVPFAMYAENVNLSLSEILEKDNDGGLNQIKNVSDPIDEQDVVTKAYLNSLENKLKELEARILKLEPSVQARLLSGETPFDIYTSDNNLLDSLYGKVYGGGLIFYLNIIDGSGMVVSDKDIGIAEWGSASSVLVSELSTELGTGLSNTETLVLKLPSGNYAAFLCDNLVYNSFSDWFLPSIDELLLIGENVYQKGLGNFFDEEGTGEYGYFSSSKKDDSAGFIYVWLPMSDKGQSPDYFPRHVRAARFFSND